MTIACFISVNALVQQLSRDARSNQRNTLINEGRQILRDVQLAIHLGNTVSDVHCSALEGIAAAFKSLEPEVENANVIHDLIMFVVGCLVDGLSVPVSASDNFKVLAEVLDIVRLKIVSKVRAELNAA